PVPRCSASSSDSHAAIPMLKLGKMMWNEIENANCSRDRNSGVKAMTAILSRSRRNAFRDEPRGALSGHVRPKPLNEHSEPVLQLREEGDMDQRPQQPCKPTAGAKSSALEHGEVLPDHGHVAAVEIAERFRLDLSAKR